MGLFSKSTKLEKLAQRLDEVERDNKNLRSAMSEISTNLIAVDSMIKIMLTAQQQVAIDMNTIYDALQQVIGTANRGAVDPLEEYLVKMSPFGSDDDDGGMIN